MYTIIKYHISELLYSGKLLQYKLLCFTYTIIINNKFEEAAPPLHNNRTLYLYLGYPVEATVKERVCKKTSDVQSKKIKIETGYTLSPEIEDDLHNHKHRTSQIYLTSQNSKSSD